MSFQAEKFPLPFEGEEYLGHIAYPLDTTEQRPLIIVCPNYAGLNEFDEAMCAYLASIGYVALAIDVYGEAFPFDMRTNKSKFDPATASEHRHGAFAAMNAMLSDWAKFRRFLRAWIVAGKSHSAACSERCGAIGYCFGGCAVLEMVRDGIPGVQGVVSFHGVLTSYPQALPDTPAPPMVSTPSNSYANKDVIVYIENGSDDHLVPDEAIRGFKDEMTGAGINWKFSDYADTAHGFSLLADAGYHEVSDRRSVQEMLALWAELWPEVKQKYVAVNAAGTAMPPPVATAKM